MAGFSWPESFLRTDDKVVNNNNNDKNNNNDSILRITLSVS